MRIGKNFALALVIAAMSAGATRASTTGGNGEAFNAFEPLPPASMTGGATSFTIVFKGDVTNSINTLTTQNDPGLNPFLYVNNQLNNGGTTSVMAALDGNGNTVVTFTGSNPISADSTFDFGNNLPHVGLSSASGTAALDLISQTWSNSSTMSSYTLPGGLSVSVFNGGTTDPFAIFYAQVTSNGLSSGEWFELPYTAGTAPRLTITNYTGSAETLSDAGYFLSPTQIPLDNLNFGSTPPPGFPDSPFIPLPGLDGQTLTPGDGIGGAGGSITTQGLPEPSSIISMAIGLLIAAGYCGRKRIASRLGRTAPIA